MSVKECSYHKDKRRKLLRRIVATLLVIILTILITFLVIWAILQPRKPRFDLQDTTIYAFNVSAPVILTSNFQVTINVQNPNNKIGIYYDRIDVYAAYHNQQITYFTAIPSFYQGQKDNNVWSPFVYGTNVPVAPYNGMSLTQDQSNGAISLLIKLNGRVRWKVGSFISGGYHLHVTCPAYIPFGNYNTGIGVKYQLAQRCSVSV